ncbi:helix-turn-helix domain-containing protein [Streptomyces sp. NPDC016845]|uniref:helix-turn-helix domain-containing protein n=1 Tax=Streptomyces sp. NPDC016845 TaxID=3364972 RepID=UPI00379FC8B1
MAEEVLRACKFALDPAPAQAEALARHAGAARWGLGLDPGCWTHETLDPEDLRGRSG